MPAAQRGQTSGSANRWESATSAITPEARHLHESTAPPSNQTLKKCTHPDSAASLGVCGVKTRRMAASCLSGARHSGWLRNTSAMLPMCMMLSSASAACWLCRSKSKTFFEPPSQPCETASPQQKCSNKRVGRTS